MKIGQAVELVRVVVYVVVVLPTGVRGPETAVVAEESQISSTVSCETPPLVAESVLVN